MKVGDSVQIMEGGKGIRWKVGTIAEEILLEGEVYGYWVVLAGGARVPKVKDELELRTHKQRGENYRTNNVKI